MRKVIVKSQLSLSQEEIWKLITDIKNYPTYIKYCLKAKGPEPIKKGDWWWDWTTIMVLPLKINHQVVELNPNNYLKFLVPLFFVGNLTQEVTLTETTKGTQVVIEVSINLKNKIADLLLGDFLYKRTQTMINSIYANFSKKHG